MTSGRLRIRAVAATVVAFLAVVSPAVADRIDQANTPATGTTYDCVGAPLYQDFTPQYRQLAAVDVFLRAGGNFPSTGTTVTIAVRAFGGGVADGTVLSRQTVFLAPPPMFGDVVAHAAFSPPLVLEPPGQFVIEGPHEQARIVSWYGRDDDPYARGAGFACGGQPVSGFDLNFRTFAPDDLAAPETALVSGPRPGSFAPSATAAFAFTAADDLSYAANVRFECSLDGAAAVPCASPFETGRLDDGHHIFTVDAIDEAGRRDPTAATTAWTVDVAPPTAPTITGPTVVRGSRAVYRFSARDAATSASRLQFRCAVDSAALHLCAARFVARLNHGAHVLRVLAVDLAGNRSPAARRRIRVVP